MSILIDEFDSLPRQIALPEDAITAAVILDLKSRADVGVRKYKTTLEQNNHQNMLQHAYEEALDLALYLKKLMEENDRLKIVEQKEGGK